MALKIIWTRNALEHLEDILNYWELRNRTNSYSNKLYKLFQKGLDVYHGILKQEPEQVTI